MESMRKKGGNNMEIVEKTCKNRISRKEKQVEEGKELKENLPELKMA